MFNAAAISDEEKKGLPPAYELAWNHTTLRALRIEPSITYLQSLYPFPNQLALADEIEAMFPGELMSHLEFVRFDGNVTCFGLPLIRFTTETRLDRIIEMHEEAGCPIFNPHRYTLEEGGMKQTDEIQLAFKRKADPQGAAQPGKMIALGEPGLRLSQRQAVPVQGAGAVSCACCSLPLRGRVAAQRRVGRRGSARHPGGGAF